MGMEPSAFGRFIDQAACRRYIISRQTPEGAFCFYRGYGVEEPNGLDTYSAVASLRILGAPIPNADELVAWLQRLQDGQGGYPNLAMGWYALETLRRLGAPPLHDPRPYLNTEQQGLLAVDWRGRTLDRSSLLLALSRLSMLAREWGIAAPPPFRDEIEALLDSLQGPQGGCGSPAENLVDTYRALIIMDLLEVEHPPRMMAFAEICRDPECGFRLVPNGSAGSLETVHAGIGVFNHYGADLPWETVSTVRRYIAACQTGDGGFGRVPGAIPTLADTWLALESLRQVSDTAA